MHWITHWNWNQRTLFQSPCAKHNVTSYFMNFRQYIYMYRYSKIPPMKFIFTDSIILVEHIQHLYLNKMISRSGPITKVPKRGAFILLEGVDRCGKTTQCSLLLQHLLALGVAALAIRFPDRTTLIGELINGYLQQAQDMDDRAVHLLFSANRWEASGSLAQALADGKTVVCDRYAYSGVAFSSAKSYPDQPHKNLSLEWCKSCDIGLPAPDAVIFLDLAQEEAEKRGGFGGERYEKTELQKRVRQRFSELQEEDENQKRIPWYIVNAGQTIEDVQRDINEVVQNTLETVNGGSNLKKMWEDGDYILPIPSED